MSTLVNYSWSNVELVANSVGVVNAGVDIGSESYSLLMDLNLSLKVWN